MKNGDLIKRAILITKKIRHNGEFTSGEVGSALLTSNDNVFVGVSLNAACAIGFCAEHSAIAAMVAAGETKIKKIVALDYDRKILPPCGRCRELIYQINKDNKGTEVVISNNKTLKLGKLLPHPWEDFYR